MTINYQNAFANLRQRRLGSDFKNIPESYEILCNKKKDGLDALKYTLGAMEEVKSQYTEKLIEDGNRVKECLEKKVDADFMYQGSVPMNVHIRSNSDIDLLVINNEFYTYNEELSQYDERYKGGGFDAISSMEKLRKDCENALEQRYYGADIDKSGDKSIKISGGSFARSVDIVPANWYDDIQYNYFDKKDKRAIQIFNKTTKERPMNKPFLFQEKILEKDILTNGNSNKAIRLLKNIKEDSGYKIESLSSYDIASLVWNMPNQSLNYQLHASADLNVLNELENWFGHLINNKQYLLSLKSPDDSRTIIDGKDDKIYEILCLYTELQNLIKAIYKDIEISISNIILNNNIPLDQMKRRLLSEQLYV